jgi:hypothetical protein
MWLVSCKDGALADYLVCLTFMKRPFVSEAFVVYSHSRRSLQLCLVLDPDEEIDIQSWFPSFTVHYFDDDDTSLDQPLTIDACMLMSMSSSELVHTKNLSSMRSRLCKRLGLTIRDTCTVLEE